MRDAGVLKRIGKRGRDAGLRLVSASERALGIGRTSLLPPAHLRAYYYRSLAPSRFTRACEEARTELLSRGLQPTSRVLDVGCGIGNLAVGLIDYLKAPYVGMDIHAEALAWCQRAITAKRPDFTFLRADVFSEAYNPSGTTAARDYRFPLADHSFDFVLLGSLFTHMLPEGLERYVEELARLLAPGGVCVASYFLLNDETRGDVEAGRSFMRFDVPHESGTCRLHRRAVPEAAVAFEEAYVRAIHERVGLAVRDVRRGGWASGRAHDQDVLVAVPVV